MERDLSYGRERFERALALLEERDLRLLGGWRNTPNNRLRAAVLGVYQCALQHLPTRASFDAFARLLAELRDRDAFGRVLATIETLPANDAADFARRLAAIARGVVRLPLPSEQFPARRGPEPGCRPA